MTGPAIGISLTETQWLTSLRTVLGAMPLQAQIQANGQFYPIEILRAQTNRVPQPAGPDFVMMTPGSLARLETNTTTFDSPTITGTRSDTQPQRVTVQVDVYGPNSAANATIITTLFRSSWATDLFQQLVTGDAVQPLYTSDPRQLPYLNGEQQIEERYSIDLEMQVNPITTVAQQFMDEIAISGFYEVDAAFPPE